jgi:acetylglutamate kinase
VMGLAGLAKRQIVQPLVARGLPALGLTGMDGGLVRCRKLAKPDLGWVGEPVEVNAPALRALATSGWIVCLSPLCIDERGDLYNVNADPVATAVATGLGAERLIFVTDVGGVLDQGKVMEHLDSADFVRLTESGAIGSGMTPKLKACFEALKGGVNEVTITDLDGLISAHGGTRVSL